MTVCQFAIQSTGRLLSRAGSLLQGIGGVAEDYFRHKKAAYQTRLFLGRCVYTLNQKSLGKGSGTAVAETAGCNADYFFEGSGHVALIEEAASE
jgi:hypothetical protein